MLWQNRELIVTKSALLFARPGVDMIVDSLPISNVKAVKVLSNAHDDLHDTGDSSMVVITCLNPEYENMPPVNHLGDGSGAINFMNSFRWNVNSDVPGSPHGVHGLLRATSLRQSSTRQILPDKIFTLRAPTDKDAKEFAAALEMACEELRHEKPKSMWERLNLFLESVHKSPTTHYCVFALIGANFVVNCLINGPRNQRQHSKNTL